MLPGDVVSSDEIAGAVVKVAAKIAIGTIKEVRVYADDKVVCKANPNAEEIALEFKLDNITAKRFIRVEAEGEDKEKVMVATPFFIK